jgi:hypothetical protein
MANRCHVGLRTAAADQNVHVCPPGFQIQGNPIAAPVGAHLMRDALRLSQKLRHERFVPLRGPHPVQRHHYVMAKKPKP